MSDLGLIEKQPEAATPPEQPLFTNIERNAEDHAQVLADDASAQPSRGGMRVRHVEGEPSIGHRMRSDVLERRKPRGQISEIQSYVPPESYPVFDNADPALRDKIDSLVKETKGDNDRFTTRLFEELGILDPAKKWEWSGTKPLIHNQSQDGNIGGEFAEKMKGSRQRLPDPDKPGKYFDRLTLISKKDPSLRVIADSPTAFSPDKIKIEKAVDYQVDPNVDPDGSLAQEINALAFESNDPKAGPFDVGDALVTKLLKKYQVIPQDGGMFSEWRFSGSNAEEFNTKGAKIDNITSQHLKDESTGDTYLRYTIVPSDNQKIKLVVDTYGINVPQKIRIVPNENYQRPVATTESSIRVEPAIAEPITAEAPPQTGQVEVVDGLGGEMATETEISEAEPIIKSEAEKAADYILDNVAPPQRIRSALQSSLDTIPSLLNHQEIRDQVRASTVGELERFTQWYEQVSYPMYDDIIVALIERKPVEKGDQELAAKIRLAIKAYTESGTPKRNSPEHLGVVLTAAYRAAQKEYKTTSNIRQNPPPELIASAGDQTKHFELSVTPKDFDRGSEVGIDQFQYTTYFRTLLEGMGVMAPGSDDYQRPLNELFKASSKEREELQLKGIQIFSGSQREYPYISIPLKDSSEGKLVLSLTPEGYSAKFQLGLPDVVNALTPKEPPAETSTP